MRCSHCQSTVENHHVPGCAAEPRTEQLLRLIAHELIVIDQARRQLAFSQERVDEWRREYDTLARAGAAQTWTGNRCPRCDSPQPPLHPAVQSGGEVQPCPDEFHALAMP